jgi:predicted DNA-binding transcriptional regulator AlpA
MTNEVFPDPARAEGRQLLDAKAVARKLGCSARHVFRLADAGAMPFGLKVGALRRWDCRQIDEWISGGCPPVRMGVK